MNVDKELLEVTTAIVAAMVIGARGELPNGYNRHRDYREIAERARDLAIEVIGVCGIGQRNK